MALKLARMVPAKRLHSYLQRLYRTAIDNGPRAVLIQLTTSLQWRFSPQRHAMRNVMRENGDFDALHGTDTSAEIPLEMVGISDAEAANGNGVYRAIPESYFRSALFHLNISFENYTFIDYGSGKGKALLLAYECGFRKIIGIEYSEELHQIALLNLDRYKIAKNPGTTIEALLVDARQYEPPCTPLVCFFFNPFGPVIWRQVLIRLHRSYQLNPRPIHIVYVNIRDVNELEDVFSEFELFLSAVTMKNVIILSAIPKV